MKTRIVELLEEFTGVGKEEILQEKDLLESGIIDSLTYGELIFALEDEYDIEIQPTVVPLEKWRTVEGIVDIVKSQM